ncbi:hypothetical protein Val02_74630 [Virgisporangium aliadipatigenens]|uniref:Uncharacterized protein n=1 Tax=Virgisporangium aliadipatigenens TaxID=741659 RepID=A0A8J4DVX3_9ACTN|nr:hypothetical protein Val02_74630 [Virgisporangium aliadipatigenens]
MYTFQPDGVLVADHRASTPITATAPGGITFTGTTTGVTTGRYTATPTSLQIEVVTSTEVSVRQRQGTVTDSATVRPGDQSRWGYSCARGDLQLCRQNVSETIVLLRAGAAPGGVARSLPPLSQRPCERNG